MRTDLQRLLVEPRAQGAAGPDRPHPADRQRLGPAQAVQGQCDRVGRDSKTDSLFDPTIATFEDDAGAYNQKDAHGFIRLNALRMRIAANFGMTFGLGAFMLYMLFIIGELAWKSKAGKLGTFILFFVLAFGMLGFVAKFIIQKLWGI
jgi:hypothetical protein